MKQGVRDIHSRCEFLEGLGFEIRHEDSNVRLNLNDSQYIDFDFSATAMDMKSILHHVTNECYSKGKEDGEDSIRTDFKNLMKINVDKELVL